VRLPDKHRFRVDLTEAIEPRRDAEGKVDIAGTMQVITSVVEGWVREHPEQWLWVHRRWR
jgi:KDO2-lipid IV(A) lauroyltransferase